MRHWAGSPVLHRRANVHSLAWEFAMRPTMVSLLTLLLLAGSHARAQVPGPVDPTDLKVRVLKHRWRHVRAAIAAERKNAGGVRDREQLRHQRPCEAEGLQSLFCAQTGSNLA